MITLYILPNTSRSKFNKTMNLVISIRQFGQLSKRIKHEKYFSQFFLQNVVEKPVPQLITKNQN